MSQTRLESCPANLELTPDDLIPDVTQYSAPETAAADQPGADPRSFAERFLDSFLDEKNIRWLLTIGAAMVFGSSLMLVTRQWSSWPATVQFLTVLGYTAAGFGFAEFGRFRLGLRTTSTVLHLLTLLLMPLSFLSLSWLAVATPERGALSGLELLVLMIPATGFLGFASSRILDHLLNGRQTTFLISYQLLCLAGAMPAAQAGLPAFGLLAVFWLVLTLGVIKVNRHTFWLAEERRLPRVFGFLPIAILGLQFVTLVAVKCVSAIPAQWIGAGCVMAAATVLVTARSVADVFRQRTGDLVRPLPWPIAAPLLTGLVLTVAGVVLSFNGFSYVGATTYAVVPTAAIAALLMGAAARETKSAGFVWASLICTTLAYQCAPTLFSDVVVVLKQGAASAIREQRLPLAFYGLTYLPLLLAVAWTSRRMAAQGVVTLSRPLKQYVTLVSLLLFVAAFTHLKALCLVSTVNVAAFLVFAIVFRDRHYVLPALASLVCAVGSAIPCLNAMQLTHIDPWHSLTLLAGLAALLTATPKLDHRLHSIAVPESSIGTRRNLILQRRDGTDRNLCQLTGWWLAALLGGHWIAAALLSFGQPLSTAAVTRFGILLATFGLFTIRNPRYLAGVKFWLFLLVASVVRLAGHGLDAVSLVSVFSVAAAGLSLAGFGWLKLNGSLAAGRSLQLLRLELEGSRDSAAGRLSGTALSGWKRQAQAFVVPLCDLSLVVLSFLAVGFHLPSLVVSNLGQQPLLVPLATSVTVVWLFAAVWMFGSRLAATAAILVLPLWVTAILSGSLSLPLSLSWYPVVWGVVASIAGVGLSRSTAAQLQIMSRISQGWLVAVVLLTTVTFDLPARLAAGVGLLGLYLHDRRRRSPTDSTTAEQHFSRLSWLAIATNLQVLWLTAAVGGLQGLVLSVFMDAKALLAVPGLFLVTALSVLVFERSRRQLDSTAVTAWTAVLRAGLVVLAALSLAAREYSVVNVGLMLVGCVSLVAVELIEAVRLQRVQRVWFSFLIAAAATAWLWIHGVIDPGNGTSQLILLACAGLSLTAAKICSGRSQLAVIAGPCQALGRTLPAVVALIGTARGLLDFAEPMPGWNSLAMLTAAAIYFQLALTTRQRRFAILTVAIFDAALLLLWHSLSFTDPQFYLIPIGLSVLGFVELMKKELPAATHDPLRYVGALTILVSPMFSLLGGSWLHILSLMVLSVLVIVLAIGLRLRALVYTGSAFLLADLVAMVIRTSIDHPSLLWVCGVAFGAAVMTLAAICENHREQLLSRIRRLSAELATWH